MECGHTNNKKPARQSSIGLLWSHQGLNLGPPDYESGATNQLSYRTVFCLLLVISALGFVSSVGHYRKVTPFDIDFLVSLLFVCILFLWYYVMKQNYFTLATTSFFSATTCLSNMWSGLYLPRGMSLSIK